MKSESSIVSFVSRYAVYHGRAKSVLGQNAMYCCRRFGATLYDLNRVKDGNICLFVYSSISDDLRTKENLLLELISLRDGSVCFILRRR